MTGMRFGAGHLFPSEIETEIFSAVMAEFKEVLIQDHATNLTVTDLHPFFVRGLR
jgi:hypothetical protein